MSTVKPISNVDLVTFVSLIHFIHTIGFAVYPWVSKDYDDIYLIWAGLVLLHWQVLKGECVLGYFERKAIDPEYRLGSGGPGIMNTYLGPVVGHLTTPLNTLSVAWVLLRNWGSDMFWFHFTFLSFAVGIQWVGNRQVA